MTSYSYTLEINDSQYLALEAALELMIEHCDAKMADGPCAPFLAHKTSCHEMLEKLTLAVAPKPFAVAPKRK